MSIYISIVTLEDPEIYSTVTSAINGADDSESVSIGIAAAVSDDFYNKFIKKLENFPQVIINRLDKQHIKGVGMGRKASRFAYNDQTYILQIDSHTLFDRGWDTTLVDLHKDAVIASKNDKTILTAYLGPYRYDDGKPRALGGTARYCIYSPQQMTPSIRLAAWTDRPLSTFPERVNAPTDKFVPAIKIGAHFMFGTKEFAKYSGLPIEAVFYDEELMQTINLLNNGFYLVFPNTELPLYHRYINEDSEERESGRDLYSVNEEPTLLMTRNIYDFYYQNLQACIKYEAYAKYNIETGMVRPFHVPESFDWSQCDSPWS